MSKNMTMLILSFDKFSDLWDGHIKLLEQNWPDRDMETIIVTDAPTEKSYTDIQIINGLLFNSKSHVIFHGVCINGLKA